MWKVYLLLMVAGIGILVIIFHNPAEEINSGWLSYDEAVNESKRTGKMLFIFISSPTCPTCAKFRDFFSNEEVMSKINGKFLPVYIKEPSYSPVPVSAFPTFCTGYPENLDCFYTSSGDLLLKRLGVS
ncbi:MAG: thioredoxin family protein [Archaeoglobaceae archaeon]|nr:thioredoxin family protein [Archaeoglobaceae archaeon]MDW8118757.1 thioredoxin family protein [Archaeoglobaceae archaeon]